MRVDTLNRNIYNHKIKYFLSYEGIKTEVEYFNGIIDYRKEIGIRDDIEFIPLLRNHSFLGWSNPLKAFERTKLTIDNLKNRNRNIAALISSIVEYCFYRSCEFSKRKDASALYDTLIDIMKVKYNLNKNDNISFDDYRIESFVEYISNFFEKNYKIKRVDEFIKTQFIEFDPQKDKVCIIVDRDRKSVSKEQYNELIKKCDNNNYELYISNPCFEFWLLLHFNKVFDINKELIAENKKMSDEVNPLHYCETELIKLLPEYEKNNICFTKLFKRIPIALNNEIYFSESLEDLESNIGSNVAKLIKDLQKV